MATTKQQRDVTRALEIARRIHLGIVVSQDDLNALVLILTDIDARTGRRDPSKRGKTTSAVKSPAKKAADRSTVARTARTRKLAKKAAKRAVRR